MKKRGREFVVILLDLEEDEAIKRLLHRRICKGCGEIYNIFLHGELSACPACAGELYQRKDEVKEEFIRNRFNEHYTKT
jgi:adenylate kinase